MQIGIISDIHGGLVELIGALAIFRREKVDRVVCAGDLVDFGAYSDEVVKRIFDEGIPCVRGNHDRDAAERQRLRLNHNLYNMPDKPLSAETLALLAQLPPMLRYTWEGTSILLTHANPWGDDTYINIKSTAALFRRVIEVSQADITIIGHTHQPMWIESAGKMILNPGSASVNYTCLFGTCAILSLPAHQFRLLNVETGDDVAIEQQKIAPA
jgi:putative phosphoesterase